MLVSWENKAGEANDSKDVFQGLLADFWEGLGLLFLRHADNEEADPQALEGIATLLQVSLVSDIIPAQISMLSSRIQQINVAVGVIHVLESGQSETKCLNKSILALPYVSR